MYDTYYDTLRRDVAAVRGHPGALLLDIHGQSKVRDAILRGPKDGLTADSAPLYAGQDGMFARLLASGVKVEPASAGEREDPGFNGGYTVRAFGRNTPDGIDSIQLEFGADWRATPEQIERTASLVADALAAWLKAAHAY